MLTITPEVYGSLLIGGNHLASSLISYGCLPSDQIDYDQVLHTHGLLCADMWVAWRGIMDLRACVESSAEAL
jgi:hypothetical protein